MLWELVKAMMEKVIVAKSKEIQKNSNYVQDMEMYRHQEVQ